MEETWLEDNFQEDEAVSTQEDVLSSVLQSCAGPSLDHDLSDAI